MLLAITVVMIAIHAVGIHLVGNVAAWQRWLHVHAWMFRLWRLALYMVILRSWWWMRTCVRQRDPSPDAQRRLMRAEIAAVLAIVLTEIVALRDPV
ncbi:putative membrane protein [Burkholderia sp. MSHR3999]|nr:putative membrane protein [Burkholderia sp. MSHR3999]